MNPTIAAQLVELHHQELRAEAAAERRARAARRSEFVDDRHANGWIPVRVLAGPPVRRARAADAPDWLGR